MESNLKQRLRRRLFGGRMWRRLADERSAIGRLADLHYRVHHPGLISREWHATPEDFEFSRYSQNGEDGILLYLLASIGAENHHIVEIGTEDGHECNSANLILHFGWHGWLIECDAAMARGAERFFRGHGAGDRVVVMNERALPENIDALLSHQDIPREIDILSIDIDSHDYWLWQALTVLTPRLVVIEYNASFGPSQSVTIPYAERPPLSRRQHRYYQGASITALQRLAARKGYDLVAGDSRGVNAFFIRRDIREAAGLATAAPEQVYRPHFRRTLKLSQEAQQEIVSGFKLTEVE